MVCPSPRRRPLARSWSVTSWGANGATNSTCTKAQRAGPRVSSCPRILHPGHTWPGVCLERRHASSSFQGPHEGCGQHLTASCPGGQVPWWQPVILCSGCHVRLGRCRCLQQEGGGSSGWPWCCDHGAWTWASSSCCTVRRPRRALSGRYHGDLGRCVLGRKEHARGHGRISAGLPMVDDRLCQGAKLEGVKAEV